MLGVAQQTVSDWLINNTESGITYKPDARVKLTQPAKEKALDRVEAGESQEQIAADFGVSKGAWALEAVSIVFCCASAWEPLAGPLVRYLARLHKQTGCVYRPEKPRSGGGGLRQRDACPFCQRCTRQRRAVSLPFWTANTNDLGPAHPALGTETKYSFCYFDAFLPQRGHHGKNLRFRQ
jgi:hypothetical protein